MRHAIKKRSVQCFDAEKKEKTPSIWTGASRQKKEREGASRQREEETPA